MLSRKPIAKQFKKQVKEILKSIRMTRGYIKTNEDDTDDVILAKSLIVAQKTIERNKQKIKELESTVEIQPKVELADVLMVADGLIDMGEMAN